MCILVTNKVYTVGIKTVCGVQRICEGNRFRAWCDWVGDHCERSLV